jgi:RNA polymerase sigma factor (TIGR02999 family)
MQRTENDFPHQFTRLYTQLRQIARARLRRGAPLTLLDTGALVHELFNRYNNNVPVRFDSDAHFLAYSSVAMRNLIVDHVRSQARESKVPLSYENATRFLTEFVSAEARKDQSDIVKIDDALTELARTFPRLAQVVEMRFFGGYTEEEISQALSTSTRTVRRDWEKARALLIALLTEPDSIRAADISADV